MNLPQDVKALIQKGHQRVRNINFYSGVFVFIFGLIFSFIAYMAYLEGETTPQVNQMMLWMCGIFVGGGLGLILYYWKPRQDLAKILERNPQKVLWIYKVISTAAMGGRAYARFTHVHARLNNKKKIMLTFKDEDDADTLLKKLQPLLPHTAFGHSQEFERLYRKSCK